MTEREKMLAGKPYDSRDAELMDMYRKARQLMGRYNAMCAADADERTAVLRQILGTMGDRVWIEPPFFYDYGCHIHMGAGSFVNFNCVFLDCNRIDIGTDVLIAPAVQIYAVGHPLKADERVLRPQGSDEAAYLGTTAPVRIGDRAWVGGGSIILPGVSIGADSTIGAGSVVTKDIPAGVLAAGNPCRVLRHL